MAEPLPAPDRTDRSNLSNLLFFLLPLILLGTVVYLFLSTGGGLRLNSPAPVEALTFERTIMRPGQIEFTVRNNSPEDLTVAQVVINEAVWPFTVDPGPTIPRLKTATILLDYGWAAGEAYGITVFSTNAIAFNTEIPVAFVTPQPQARTLWSFTLIGIYVGVIPVFLGVMWFPALRKLGRKWMVFLMAVTAGLLVFLGLDTLAEAIEQSAQVPGPFQGIGLIGIGVVGTVLLLYAISSRQTHIERSEADHRMAVAYMIAIGIGLHNLGEGLAIGAAYSIGEIALGAFLVVGFILQNITEGLAIIAPVLRDRPGIGQLALLGLIGGAPAIIGAWIGAFTPSPILSVLFLAIGTGAIFEVIYEIARLTRADLDKESMPLVVFSGVLTGMALLWVTGLLIK